MKYIMSFALTKETFKKRVSRFLKTGGQPPEGV